MDDMRRKCMTSMHLRAYGGDGRWCMTRCKAAMLMSNDLAALSVNAIRMGVLLKHPFQRQQMTMLQDDMTRQSHAYQ